MTIPSTRGWMILHVSLIVRSGIDLFQTQKVAESKEGRTKTPVTGGWKVVSCCRAAEASSRKRRGTPALSVTRRNVVEDMEEE